MSVYKKLILIVLAILAAVSILQGCRNAALYSQDFQWDAAKALYLGYCPYEQSMNPTPEFLSLGYEEVYKQMEANQFPSLLMLLWGYIFLSPMAARYAWIVSNLFFTAAILFLLRKTFFKDCSLFEFSAMSLLMLAGTPWRNQMGVGQHTLFSFMFFMLAVFLDDLRKGSEKKALLFWLQTLCLAVSYFKYTLTAPLALYFVYKKRYKELAFSVIIHVIMTVYAAIHLGEPFINMIKEPLQVAANLTGEGSIDIGAVLGSGSMVMILSALIMLVLFGLSVFLKAGREKELFALLLMWSLIMTYHRSYDFWVLAVVYPMYAGFAFKNKEAGSFFNKNISGINRITVVYYFVLLLYIFFGLRFFDESQFSLNIAMVLYYVFTFMMTVQILRKTPTTS